METSKVISDEQEQPKLKDLVLTVEENKRLVDFFSLLIEIDQRNEKERRKNEAKLPVKEADARTD